MPGLNGADLEVHPGDCRTGIGSCAATHLVFSSSAACACPSLTPEPSAARQCHVLRHPRRLILLLRTTATQHHGRTCRDWYHRDAPRYPPEESMVMDQYEIVYQVHVSLQACAAFPVGLCVGRDRS